MSQAVHIESLGTISDKSLWQRLQVSLSPYKKMAYSAADSLLAMAVTVSAHRRSQSTPLRYSRLNRHTWRRYSAMIIARDELTVEEYREPLLNPQPVSLVVVNVEEKKVISVNVNRVAVQPIWASANHDWQSFGALND